jgi:hypothetical protein
LGDIASKANLYNFNAQQSGLNQLEGVNSAYQNRITGANNNLQGMLTSERFNDKTNMPGMQQMPSFSQYQSKFGGNSGRTNGDGIQPITSDGSIDFSNTDWARSGGQANGVNKSTGKTPAPIVDYNTTGDGGLPFSTTPQEAQSGTPWLDWYNNKNKKPDQSQWQTNYGDEEDL